MVCITPRRKCHLPGMADKAAYDLANHCKPHLCLLPDFTSSHAILGPHWIFFSSSLSSIPHRVSCVSLCKTTPLPGGLFLFSFSLFCSLSPINFLLFLISQPFCHFLPKAYLPQLSSIGGFL